MRKGSHSREIVSSGLFMGSFGLVFGPELAYRVAMNKAQRIALDFHCRLATETLHPRFRRLRPGGLFSIVLTVNSGYE